MGNSKACKVTMCVSIRKYTYTTRTPSIYIFLSHCKKRYKLRNQQPLLLTSSRSSMNSDSDNIFMFFFSHGTERERAHACLIHVVKVSVPQKAERSIKKKLVVSSNSSINGNGRRTLLSPASFLSRVPFPPFCPLSAVVLRPRYLECFRLFPFFFSLLSLCVQAPVHHLSFLAENVFTAALFLVLVKQEYSRVQ